MLVPFCGKHEIKLDLPEYSIVQYHLSRFTNLGLLEIACIGRDNILQTLKFVLHVWPGICFDMDNIFFFSPPAEAFLSARPGGRSIVARFGVDLTFLDPGTSSQIEGRG